MAKFKFEMSSVVNASSIEDALAQIGSHIATCKTHVANERELADCHPLFDLTIVPDDIPHDDHRKDPATEMHGAVPLNLDPESPEGIEHADQLEARAKADEAARAAKAAQAEKDGRTDAENLALHSKAEQAKHA